MSKFQKLVEKLVAKGYSHEAATRIAAAAGDKKLGKEEMARRSAASRKRHEAQSG